MDAGFRRRQRKYKMYDKLHRGFVNACIGVTLASGAFLGYKIYEYFRYVRPLHKMQYQLNEEELLNEGKSIEADAELST